MSSGDRLSGQATERETPGSYQNNCLDLNLTSFSVSDITLTRGIRDIHTYIHT